jgi:hypothetical protein
MSPRQHTHKRRRDRPSGLPAAVKAGDSVVVKPGVRDPDFDVDVGGWQGHVLAEPDADGLILIGWDSVTLRQMPDALVAKSEEQGLNWAQMILGPAEIEVTSPRDSARDVRQAIRELEKKHAWSFLGEEGQRINQILAGVNPDNEMAVMRAWKRHLDKCLVFSFEAEVAEFQERGPLRARDRLKVLDISDVDDFYGIIVSAKAKHGWCDFPLCDLEVVDEGSPNYQPVHDYCVWFANR